MPGRVAKNNIAELINMLKYMILSDKVEFQSITSARKQTLNWYQALSFSHVRKVDSSIARYERQKELLLGIADKAKPISIGKYPHLLNILLHYIKTNIDSTKLLF